MTSCEYDDLPISPSTLSYRDRLRMKEDTFAYASLYSTSKSQDVFSRLSLDASGRQVRSAQGPRPKSQVLAWPDYVHDHEFTNTGFYSQGNLSGFITNTSKAVYTPGHTFKTGHLPTRDVPVESLHPMQMRRYKKRDPVTFMSAARPDTESCNQTLRMMGTYSTDFAHAKRLGLNIPNSCPGGAPWFHSDVRLSEQPIGSRNQTWRTGPAPMN